ncbi:DUF4253 domain-containing protein [Kitasatospora sp. NPDC059571]|uniref:DUF4253 domain-containing protein n=1 Tax=Kitasatospora sp. NPDC059571 TaxID=3346871 RepID=UPI00367FCE4C
MSHATPPAADLGRLFGGVPADPSALPAGLPPGHLVRADEGAAARPVMWMSDGPAPAGLWELLHRARAASGLWPLLLAPLRHDEEYRPWQSAELYPEQVSSPDLYDPAALLARRWTESATDEDEDPEVRDSRAPFGRSWPGLAPAPARVDDPDARARALAARLLRENPALRIGLVAAGSGAEALSVCGWSGPVNHESDTAKISAVLLDWERRFGAQVVEVGFDTLHLSIAAPPTDIAEALLVAAEHATLCPDNIFQGPGTLAAYAPDLLGADSWTLWWD